MLNSRLFTPGENDEKAENLKMGKAVLPLGRPWLETCKTLLFCLKFCANFIWKTAT